ncbi:MAG: GAF domain-containing sensor histidine kinase [Thermodesulforhabdaceae bacterium]
MAKNQVTLLFDQMVEEDKSFSRLIALSDFLSQPKTLRELLDGSLQVILREFDLDAGRIYLFDSVSGDFCLITHYGLDVSGLERVKIGQGFTGKAAELRSFIAYRVEDLEDRVRSQFLQSKGLKIVYCVPFVVLGKVEGVMNLGSTKDIMLSVQDMKTLFIMGHQIGLVVAYARLNEVLNERINLLESRKETIKFFAYSISHDLKSPAVGLYGLTKRLVEKYGDGLAEKGKLYCRQIMKAAEEIVNLVECINGYISARESIEEPQNFPLSDIIESIKSEFKSRLENQNVTLEVQNNLPVIRGYPHLLLRAMRNLVDNALKHGGQMLSHIKIEVEEKPDFWVIAVHDNGSGIPSHMLETIFDPFRRGKTKAEGSGLGLAIISEVAKKHGGKAWVESFPEKRDTTFYISISRCCMKRII